MTEHIDKKRKPKTSENYRHTIDAYFVPEFGIRKAQDITRSDLAHLHGRLWDRPSMANRAVAVVSSMFTWGGPHGYVPKGYNPATDIELYAERKRERFLSSAELERLGNVLREAETEGLPWRVNTA